MQQLVRACVCNAAAGARGEERFRLRHADKSICAWVSGPVRGVAAWDLAAADRAQQRDRLDRTAEVAQHRVWELGDLQTSWGRGAKKIHELVDVAEHEPDRVMGLGDIEGPPLRGRITLDPTE